MFVEVSEVGNRPYLMTPARRFAPQAADQIGRMLAGAEFADRAFVFIDWENVGQQLPDPASKPILYIQVVKGVPDIGQTVRVEQRWDVEDIFSADNITPNILVDLIHDFEEQVNEAVALRRRGD